MGAGRSCYLCMMLGHRVLLERDAENTMTIHHQKRKLSQQHDVLAALKQK
jgi:hypothetical protein